MRACNFEAEDRLSCEALVCSDCYRQAKRIFAFYPYDSEIDIRPVLEHAVAAKQLALPVCDVDGRMIFYRIKSLSDLQSGMYGIPEPPKEEIATPTCEDLILVPGIAFTKTGKRLGRGKGCYDRYLTEFPQVSTLGICRSIQLMEELPSHVWDRCVKSVLCAGIFY